MREPESIDGNVVELHPTRFLETQSVKEVRDHGQAALIILNSPLSDLEYFRRLYEHAAFLLCADGGANQLHDLMLSQTDGASVDTALPDLIHGDLDSLNDTVRKRYEQLGVEISQDPDQYSTDFGKAVNKVLERLPDVTDVLVLGSLGGRVDQGIGLLHEFYREQKFRHPGLRFWLFSEASVSTLLQAGTTVLHTPLDGGVIKRNIGILPLFGPARIRTEGLEWDVEDWLTEMGGQVSTSNHIMADKITIATDRDVLFTVERVINR